VPHRLARSRLRGHREHGEPDTAHGHADCLAPAPGFDAGGIVFDLAMPWWEFVVRGTVVYAVLMVLVRLSGKRTVGQFTPFDLLVVMLLSEAVSNALSGEDHSLLGGLLIAATLIALNMAVAYLSAHSTRVEKAVEGVPVLLARDGKVFDEVMRRHRISQAELEEALREADCELKDLRCAFLEMDGDISIMTNKKS